MIIGIGVDAVEIPRFEQWYSYSSKKLSRIFSTCEITYCRKHPKKAAERFAVRFAAREAFFKALQSAYPQQNLPFLYLCKQISIEKTPSGAPYIQASWNNIVPANQENSPSCTVSFTHTQQTAIAWVLLESINTKK